MSDADPPAPAQPTQPASAKPSAGEVEALIRHHQENLELLDQIPYEQDYVAPTEILSLVMVATEYCIDWSLGLEPGEGEVTLQAQITEPGDPDPVDVERVVRARWETLAENADGTLIPDGNTFWAHQLLGRLKRAASDELAGLALQRRGA